MGRYLIKRSLYSLLTLFLLAVLCFVLLRLFPGGPFDEDTRLAPQVLDSLKAQYGLDKTLTEQLMQFFNQLLHFDLGLSLLYSGKPVTAVILSVFPRTVGLGSVAFGLSLFVGLGVGVFGFALRRPVILNLLHLFFLSAPSLFLGPLVILVFGIWFGVLPVAINDHWSSYVLPIFVLALKPAIGVSRLVSNSMDETILQPWVKTTRAFGFSESVLIYKHVLKNSLIPVFAYIGTMAASVLSGSILIEMIFNVNGIGSLFIEALLNRDYQLVVGLTLLYGLMLTVATLTSDIAMLFVDPRLRREMH